MEERAKAVADALNKAVLSDQTKLGELAEINDRLPDGGLSDDELDQMAVDSLNEAVVAELKEE